jgi:hypothetical protein
MVKDAWMAGDFSVNKMEEAVFRLYTIGRGLYSVFGTAIVCDTDL